MDFGLLVTDLEVTYGRASALLDISFKIPAGQICGVTGPNGAGKSTLLKAIAGMTRYKGKIRWKDESKEGPPFSFPEIVGFTGHEPMLYPALTVKENLLFFGTLYRVEPLREKVESVIDRYGLLHRENDAVGSLSQGMIHRTAVCRALLHEPSLLLLDEPFSVMDEFSLKVLKDDMRDVKNRGGIVILSTHQRNLCGEMCDMWLELKKGKLAEKKDGGNP